jgi:hypothetical protein
MTTKLKELLAAYTQACKAESDYCDRFWVTETAKTTSQQVLLAAISSGSEQSMRSAARAHARATKEHNDWCNQKPHPVTAKNSAEADLFAELARK